jgi:AsmA protein
MRRRTIVVLLVSGAVGFAGAVVPWTLSTDVLRSAMSAQLKSNYGLELSVAGRSTITFLPVPRLAFENVTLTTSEGKPVVRNGFFRGELRVLPLLAARLELSELSLSDAAISVDIDRDERPSLQVAIAGLRDRFAPRDAASHIQRIVLKRAELRLVDRRTHDEAVVHGIELVANWPHAESPLDVAGSLTWRGETIDFAGSVRPSAVFAGRSSPFKVQARAPLARFSWSGDWSWPDVPRFAGRSVFETRSFHDFCRWSGLDLPLARAVQAFALDSEMVLEGAHLSWPTARLNLAGDRLQGALSLRSEGGRRTITGTLAADRLDLTGLAASFAQAPSAAGGASSNAIDLHRAGGTDLDLRLSATTARIGPVRMEDLAANVSMKPGRHEASIGRVSINKGVAKGRATLTRAAEGVEVKGQGSFDRLDLASLLGDLGAPRWIGGSAQGQFTFEGAGDTAAEVVRRLHGRAGVTLRQGELVGMALNDVVRRTDARGASAPAGRGGRTPFDEAYLNLTVTDGTAEIIDGGLMSAGLRATLQGRASLSDHVVAAKANVEGAGVAGGIVLDITGPWDRLAIVPQVGRRGGTGESSAPAALVQ